MQEANENYLEKRMSGLQSLRDGALRDVECAYLEGDDVLFNQASQAFDQSTPLMEALKRVETKRRKEQGAISLTTIATPQEVTLLPLAGA